MEHLFHILGPITLESEVDYIVIPKIIYYCWFGGKEKSNDVNEYIRGWKNVLPDYRVVEINEQNFDINKYNYTKEAYENKKFAFVSDVARIEFLYKTGGFYFDTDIKLLKPLDDFRKYTAVFGFEAPNRIMTAFMGSEAQNDLFEIWLEQYKKRHFCTSDGVDATTNVEGLTSLLQNKKNLKLDGSTQILNHNVIAFESSFFSPKDYETGIIRKTEDTVMIHDFKGSWKTQNQISNEKRRALLIRIIGIDNFWRLIKIRDTIKRMFQRKNK